MFDFARRVLDGRHASRALPSGLLILAILLSGVSTATAQKQYEVILKSVHGRYVVAEKDGNANANRDQAKSWERWTLSDLNGGALASGDVVTLKGAHGKYLVAEKDGQANANRGEAKSWERWTLTKQGSGAIVTGAQVNLKGAHGKFLVAEKDGRLNANRDKAASWERFQLTVNALGAGGDGGGSSAPPEPTVAADRGPNHYLNQLNNGPVTYGSRFLLSEAAKNYDHPDKLPDGVSALKKGCGWYDSTCRIVMKEPREREDPKLSTAATRLTLAHAKAFPMEFTIERVNGGRAKPDECVRYNDQVVLRSKEGGKWNYLDAPDAGAKDNHWLIWGAGKRTFWVRSPGDSDRGRNACVTPNSPIVFAGTGEAHGGRLGSWGSRTLLKYDAKYTPRSSRFPSIAMRVMHGKTVNSTPGYKVLELYMKPSPRSILDAIVKDQTPPERPLPFGISDGELVNAGSGMCLLRSNKNVRLGACDPSDRNRLWDMKQGYKPYRDFGLDGASVLGWRDIRAGASRCLTVGSKIELTTCTRVRPSQQFVAKGALSKRDRLLTALLPTNADRSRCLAAAGDQLTTKPCSATDESQQWFGRGPGWIGVPAPVNGVPRYLEWPIMNDDQQRVLCLGAASGRPNVQDCTGRNAPVFEWMPHEIKVSDDSGKKKFVQLRDKNSGRCLAFRERALSLANCKSVGEGERQHFESLVLVPAISQGNRSVSVSQLRARQRPGSKETLCVQVAAPGSAPALAPCNLQDSRQLLSIAPLPGVPAVVVNDSEAPVNVRVRYGLGGMAQSRLVTVPAKREKPIDSIYPVATNVALDVQLGASYVEVFRKSGEATAIGEKLCLQVNGASRQQISTNCTGLTASSEPSGPIKLFDETYTAPISTRFDLHGVPVELKLANGGQCLDLDFEKNKHFGPFLGGTPAAKAANCNGSAGQTLMFRLVSAEGIPRFQLLSGDRGRCLAVGPTLAEKAAAIVQEECDARRLEQLWEVDAQKKGLHLSSVKIGTFCLAPSASGLFRLAKCDYTKATSQRLTITERVDPASEKSAWSFAVGKKYPVLGVEIRDGMGDVCAAVNAPNTPGDGQGIANRACRIGIAREQVWNFHPIGTSGQYRAISSHGGLCLGANLKTNQCDGGAGQLWRLVESRRGTLRIQQGTGSKCLVRGRAGEKQPSSKAGDPFSLQECAAHASQEYQLRPVPLYTATKIKPTGVLLHVGSELNETKVSWRQHDNTGFWRSVSRTDETDRFTGNETTIERVPGDARDFKLEISRMLHNSIAVWRSSIAPAPLCLAYGNGENWDDGVNALTGLDIPSGHDPRDVASRKESEKGLHVHAWIMHCETYEEGIMSDLNAPLTELVGAIEAIVDIVESADSVEEAFCLAGIEAVEQGSGLAQILLNVIDDLISEIFAGIPLDELLAKMDPVVDEVMGEVKKSLPPVALKGGVPVLPPIPETTLDKDRMKRAVCGGESFEKIMNEVLASIEAGSDDTVVATGRTERSTNTRPPAERAVPTELSVEVDSNLNERVLALMRGQSVEDTSISARFDNVDHQYFGLEFTLFQLYYTRKVGTVGVSVSVPFSLGFLANVRTKEYTSLVTGGAGISIGTDTNEGKGVEGGISIVWEAAESIDEVGGPGFAISVAGTRMRDYWGAVSENETHSQTEIDSLNDTVIGGITLNFGFDECCETTGEAGSFFFEGLSFDIGADYGDQRAKYNRSSSSRETAKKTSKAGSLTFIVNASHAF